MRKKTVSGLKKLADKLFSEYIRRKYANHQGFASCFTCGVKKPWQELQNGHYVSRSVNSLRYDERNCHVQCCKCNVFNHGAMDSYALALQKKYGPDILKILAKDKRKSVQYSTSDLQRLILEIRGKIEGI